MKQETSSFKHIRGLCTAIMLALVIALHGCAVMQNTGTMADTTTGPLGMTIRIYQGPLDHLNAVRTGQCSMYPSCSHYAQAAVKKHGPLTGIMLACDRLIRCGRSEVKYAPKVWVNGKPGYYDPVSANDFWFNFTREMSFSAFQEHPDSSAY